MPIIINVILTILILILVPFFLGLNFEDSFKKINAKETICIPRCIVMGFAMMLALFQLIAVPMIIAGTTFHTLLAIWVMVISAFLVMSICINRNSLKAYLPSVLLNIKNYVSGLNKEQLLISLLALILIISETCLMIFRTHIDTDDARFIAEALDAYEKNSLLRIHPITGVNLTFPIGEMLKDVSSPYPIFIASISALTYVHPAIMAHAVFPILMIPMAYMVSYMIANLFFDDKSKLPVFMLILAILVLFSFESIYSWGYTMLTIIWQGRSIVAVIMIPLLWYVLLNILRSNCISKQCFLALFTVSLACADLSGMGGIMAPIIGSVFALSFLIINRKLMPAICIGLSSVPVGIYEIIYRIFRPSGDSVSKLSTGSSALKKLFKSIINAQNSYAGSGMMIALYFVALLILGFYLKDRVIRNIIVIPSVVMLVILYIGIPVMTSLGIRYQDFMTGRTFWILISPIITSFGITLFICNISDCKKRILAIGLMFPIIFYCGEFKLTNEMFAKTENAYRLPQSTVDITEHMLVDDPTPKLLVPYTIAHPFRQISSNISLLYGEDASYGRIKKTSKDLIKISDQMQLTTPDLNYIIPLAREYDVNYILFDTVYTELCKDGNINVYDYPIDENYVSDRTPTVEFNELKNITVVKDANSIYWDLSEYGLEYAGTYGQYILYKFL